MVVVAGVVMLWRVLGFGLMRLVVVIWRLGVVGGLVGVGFGVLRMCLCAGCAVVFGVGCWVVCV